MIDESRIPVLIGCGQLTQREPDPARAASPLELTAHAARLAARDAGVDDALIERLDTIVLIRAFSDTSWRFACPFGGSTNPPRTLASRLGAVGARRLVYTYAGGNMPQWSLNRLCERITRGEVDTALIAGGEALATQRAAQRAGLALDWRDDPGGEPAHWGVATRGWNDVEDKHGMRGAIYAYPLFENAIRGSLGRTPDAHRLAMGELLAGFARVAAANPLADRRVAYDATTIATPGARNPYVGYPYTRLMNANAYIDQAAAVIVTNVATANRLGVARDRRVYLHGCADAHDHWYISDRRDFHSSPAMRAVFERALRMAGVSLDAIDAFDLYRCFPSAVEVACAEIGLAPDDPRGLTVTGGLPYFGGPGNNYVTHSIAEMMNHVRARPGTLGLVSANGNYLTKHSAGIYGTEPPARPFAPEDPALIQAVLDRVPHPPVSALADADGRIETYTVMHEREGPAWSIVFGRLDDGTRFIANTERDPALLAAMCTQDFLGRAGRVRHDGARNLFTPR